MVRIIKYENNRIFISPIILYAIFLSAILAPLSSHIITQICGGLVIISIPGILFLQASNFNDLNVREFIVYVFGSSLLLLSIFGFGLTVLAAGIITEPLSRITLRAVTVIGVGILALFAAKGSYRIGLTRLTRPDSRVMGSVICFAFSGAAVVFRSSKTMIAIFVISFTLLIVMASITGKTTQTFATIASGCVLLLTVSYIPEYLRGYDVIFNFSFVQQVLHIGVTKYYTSYNYAGLLTSEALLPILAAVQPDSVLFPIKFQVQIAYALVVPTGLTLVYQRWLNGSEYITGALVFICSSGYFLLSPMVIKQELAEIFLVLGLCALSSSKYRRHNTALGILAFLIMSISHYTVAYFAVSIFVFYLIIRNTLEYTNLGSYFTMQPLVPGPIVFMSIVLSIFWFSSVSGGGSFLSLLMNLNPLLILERSASVTAVAAGSVNQSSDEVINIGRTGIIVFRVFWMVLIGIGWLSLLWKVLSHNSVDIDYLIITAISTLPLVVYFVGSNYLNLGRVLHYNLLFTSPLLVVGTKYLISLTGVDVNGKLTAVSLIIGILLLTSVIFSTGMISWLSDSEDIRIFDLEPEPEGVDIATASFLIDHLQTGTLVWGDSHMPSMFNMGYMSSHREEFELVYLGRNDGLRQIQTYPGEWEGGSGFLFLHSGNYENEKQFAAWTSNEDVDNHRIYDTGRTRIWYSK